MTDDFDSKIQAAALEGLSKTSAEALLGIQFDSRQLEVYRKAKAVRDLKRNREKQGGPRTAKFAVSVNNGQNLLHAPPLAKRYSKAQIADVIQQARGLTHVICAALDCTAQQLYAYLRRHEDLKAAQEEARQGIIDAAEKTVFENLNDPDAQIRERAAEFVLSRLGQKRGWGTGMMAAVGVKIDPDAQTKEIQAIFGIQQ